MLLMRDRHEPQKLGLVSGLRGTPKPAMNPINQVGLPKNQTRFMRFVLKISE